MKTQRTRRPRRRSIFTRKQYDSNDGFLTSVWGPALWMSLHTMSFNYPVHPTPEQKQQYRDFILNLQYVLPCGKCRSNLACNLKKLPLTMHHLASRDRFSRYVYRLHELVNRMLHKKSNLTYEDVRDRYEHFRARCKSNTMVKELGCSESLYGKKAKCILRIVPDEFPCETFQMDQQCTFSPSPAKKANKK